MGTENTPNEEEYITEIVEHHKKVVEAFVRL